MKIKLEHTTRKKPNKWPLLFQVLASVMFIVVGNEPSDEDEDVFLFSQCISFINLSATGMFDPWYNFVSASLTILFCDYHFKCVGMLIFGACVSFKYQMLSRMFIVLHGVGNQS